MARRNPAIIASPTQQTLRHFGGIFNVYDDLRTPGVQTGRGFAWPCRQVLNLRIDDDGKIRDDTGISQALSGTYRGAFATRDEERAYLVDDTQILSFDGSGVNSVYTLPVTGGDPYFLEVGRNTYYSDGVNHVVLPAGGQPREWGLSIPAQPTLGTTSGDLPEGQYQVATSVVAADGRESGATRAASIELGGNQGLSISGLDNSPHRTRVWISATNGAVLHEAALLNVGADNFTWNGPNERLLNICRLQLLRPPPAKGHHLAFHEGRIYLAQYVPSKAATIIWKSEALSYEHFNQRTGWFMVPGEVRLLVGSRGGLIIGTDDRIYPYTESSGLGDEQSQLLYGAVSGWTAYPSPEEGGETDGQVYFWTTQGVVRGLPFQNLTHDRVSLPPGTQGTGMVVEQGGFSQYVVVVQDEGDPARNQA